jgi:transposase
MRTGVDKPWMLSVQKYLAIRVAHQKEESKRSIARRLHHSQLTVAKVIASETGRPGGYKRMTAVSFPKLGAFVGRIDSILKEDESAPLKQRHTAMQLYRRLVAEEGYRGKYDQVRRYIKKHRRDRRETLVPLDHSPGERMECDFGEIAVDYPEGRRVKDVLIVTWSFSHAVFMIAVPNQRTESVLHGMVAAFECFEGLAREVWWDNPKTIATTVLRGRERVLNDDYAALASHYRFEPCACMPAKGQEKPDVESGVKALQRRACTPVPKVRDDDELNAHLRSFCLSELNRTVSGQRQTIGERFEFEKRQAIALPTHRFDACISRGVLIDKYQTATFEHNRYSVPKWAAFTDATVKAYIDRVEIVQSEKVIARHARSYGKDQWIVDPLHYVAALSVRPHALDHSNVFRDWKLPGIFSELRQRLEREHGGNAGIRQYIRVLQLLTTHPAQRLTEVIKGLWHRVHLRSEQIEARAHELAGSATAQVESGTKTALSPARETEAVGADDPADIHRSSKESEETGAVKNGATTGACIDRSGAEASIQPPKVLVPRPDLRRFNQLLSFYNRGGYALRQGESNDECINPEPLSGPVVTTQPQEPEVAHDAGRV